MALWLSTREGVAGKTQTKPTKSKLQLQTKWQFQWFWPPLAAHGILAPRLGIELKLPLSCPLQWKGQVLTTGPPGMAQTKWQFWNPQLASTFTQSTNNLCLSVKGHTSSQSHRNTIAINQTQPSLSTFPTENCWKDLMWRGREERIKAKRVSAWTNKCYAFFFPETELGPLVQELSAPDYIFICQFKSLCKA